MPSELNGIVVVDKPGNITSARVVSRIKGLFGARKVGHTGTLDPFATGVLICCINRATRLARFFLKGDKTYQAVLRLGVQTDTQDATGTVIANDPVKRISGAMLAQVASQFTGSISQVPPVYSALKHEGTPLYKLARCGKAVQKPARRVRIDRLEIMHVDLPDVHLSVTCSAGTYVRTLCADMGRALGCGGHLKTLRRIESCGFSIDSAIRMTDLDQLKRKGRLKDAVIDMNEALYFMPGLVADEALAHKIRNGMKLSSADLKIRKQTLDQGVFKVVDRSGDLIAVMGESPEGNNYIYCCVFSA
jgi:tRNA pseudouridine55 synthase